jgi:hypothetical protein
MNIYNHNGIFLQNEFTEEYYNIILTALAENRKKLKRNHNNYIYYESHHILPKSLFPEYKKEKWNLVLLNAKEHLRCHKLLTQITIDSAYHKMVCAYWKMTQTNNETMNRVEMSPEEYEELREIFSETMSIVSQRPCSESTKLLIGKANSGKRPSKIAIINSVNARKGKKRPEYAVRASANAQKGNTNVRGKSWWNNGIKSVMAFNVPDSTWVKGRLKFTDEHIKNISKSQMGNTKKKTYAQKKKLAMEYLKVGHEGNLAREKMKNENESKTRNS